jgi:hypothetical protein
MRARTTYPCQQRPRRRRQAAALPRCHRRPGSMPRSRTARGEGRARPVKRFRTRDRMQPVVHVSARQLICPLAAPGLHPAGVVL